MASFRGHLLSDSISVTISAFVSLASEAFLASSYRPICPLTIKLDRLFAGENSKSDLISVTMSAFVSLTSEAFLPSSLSRPIPPLLRFHLFIPMPKLHFCRTFILAPKLLFWPCRGTDIYQFKILLALSLFVLVLLQICLPLVITKFSQKFH